MKKEILDLFENVNNHKEKKVSKTRESQNFIKSLKKANDEYISMSFENMKEERITKQINSEYSKNFLLG